MLNFSIVCNMNFQHSVMFLQLSCCVLVVSPLSLYDIQDADELVHRNAVNDRMAEKDMRNIYTEYPEFTRKQIKEFEKVFYTYDTRRDGHIDLLELKVMMDRLQAPQTHVGLANMIKEVDEDKDGEISFEEFLLIFRKEREGDLEVGSGLAELARLTEVNIDETVG